ncbi:hypothetical protein MNV49_007534 [Pseudohyphozyma bogoriensis]|nr:hypothetical protein MNV49_007534 [Pseudohyphozyma bogoriensis]
MGTADPPPDPSGSASTFLPSPPTSDGLPSPVSSTSDSTSPPITENLLPLDHQHPAPESEDEHENSHGESSADWDSNSDVDSDYDMVTSRDLLTQSQSQNQSQIKPSRPPFRPNNDLRLSFPDPTSMSSAQSVGGDDTASSVSVGGLSHDPDTNSELGSTSSPFDHQSTISDTEDYSIVFPTESNNSSVIPAAESSSQVPMDESLETPLASRLLQAQTDEAPRSTSPPALDRSGDIKEWLQKQESPSEPASGRSTPVSTKSDPATRGRGRAQKRKPASSTTTLPPQEKKASTVPNRGVMYGLTAVAVLVAAAAMVDPSFLRPLGGAGHVIPHQFAPCEASAASSALASTELHALATTAVISPSSFSSSTLSPSAPVASSISSPDSPVASSSSFSAAPAPSSSSRSEATPSAPSWALAVIESRALAIFNASPAASTSKPPTAKADTKGKGKEKAVVSARHERKEKRRKDGGARLRGLMRDQLIAAKGKGKARASSPSTDSSETQTITANDDDQATTPCPDPSLGEAFSTIANSAKLAATHLVDEVFYWPQHQRSKLVELAREIRKDERVRRFAQTSRTGRKLAAAEGRRAIKRAKGAFDRARRHRNDAFIQARAMAEEAKEVGAKVLARGTGEAKRRGKEIKTSSRTFLVHAARGYARVRRGELKWKDGSIVSVECEQLGEKARKGCLELRAVKEAERARRERRGKKESARTGWSWQR